MEKSPISNNCGPAGETRFCGAAKKSLRPTLLGPRTATLDQNNQNDDNQHTGNNPDNCGARNSTSNCSNDSTTKPLKSPAFWWSAAIALGHPVKYLHRDNREG